MRYWGPNIKIDGTWVRTNADALPRTVNVNGQEQPNLHEGLAADVTRNSPTEAEAYEVRTQDVLRNISGNPAGKILLEAFTGQNHSVTIRPLTLAVALQTGGETSAADLKGLVNGAGTDSTMWFDPAFVSNPQMVAKHYPSGNVRADDSLFHESVHALRQILGVWWQQDVTVEFGTIEPEWDNTEEFDAVMLTNIYLSRAGRDADLRFGHGEVFVPLSAAMMSGYQNRAGDAFASRYFTEIGDFRLKMAVIHFPMAAMPLGWNPLREYERRMAMLPMFSDTSPTLPLSSAPSLSDHQFIPMDNPFGNWSPR